MFPSSGCHPLPAVQSFLFQGRPGAKKTPKMKPESSRNFNLLPQQLTLMLPPSSDLFSSRSQKAILFSGCLRQKEHR